MRKIFNWMLAAILVCGASVVMSSCGDDDDETTTSPNTYEVTLSAVLPESAAEFFTLDLAYTGSDGKTTQTTLKVGDRTEEMSEKMKKLYDIEKESAITLLNWGEKPEKKALFDQLIVRNFTFVVPAGKSFSYRATLKARTEYTQPSGEFFDVIKPFVYLGSKRISGNSEDGSVFTESLKLKAYGSVETECFADFLEMFDGEVIANDSRTMR